MKLYEINKALTEFRFEVDPDTGEILNANDLDELEMARDEKHENIALYIKNLNAEAEAYKNEKESFEAREKAAKKKAEWLKTYLAKSLNGEKFKTTKVAVSYRKSKVVDITDIDAIPEEFIGWIPKPNKIAIKKQLAVGNEVKGAELIERKNITIK